MDIRFFRRFIQPLRREVQAPAIAMLGALAAHPKLGLDTRRWEEVASLKALFAGRRIRFGFSSHDRTILEHLRLGGFEQAEQLATLWAQLLSEGGPPRIEIVHEDEDPPVLALFAELLADASVGAASVHVRSGEPRQQRALSWPLSVVAVRSERRHIQRLGEGNLPGKAPALWSSLEHNAAGHILLVPPDVCFVPGAPGHEAGVLPASAIAIAFLPESKSAAAAMALGLKLRYRLDTGAVLVVRAPLKRRGEFWFALMAALGEGIPFDEAVRLATGTGAAPFLLSSWKFLDGAKLPLREEVDAARRLLEFVAPLRTRFDLMDLQVPEFLARTLGWEQREWTAPELATALQQRLSQPGFKLPPGAGVALSQLRQAVRTAEKSLDVALSQNLQTPPPWAMQQQPSQKPPGRHLQATILSTEGPKPEQELGALLAGHTYRLEVHIGAVRAGSRFVRKPLPEASLPPSPDGHTLTIVFSDDFTSQQAPPRAEHVVLGSKGDSTRCAFAFTVPKPAPGAFAARDFSARITVLHRNRVIQTAILSAPVVTTREARPDMGRGVKQELEFPPLALDEPLEERTPFDAALVIQEDASGGAHAMVVEDEEIHWFDIDQPDLKEAILQIRTRLQQLTQEPVRPTSLEDERLVKLLVALANQGSLFWRAAVSRPGVGRSLLRGRRIQILETSVGSFIPVEFFYDLPAPHPKARLCPNAQLALETGECHHSSHQDEEEAEDFVCPAGFWGLTRILERQRVPSGVRAGGVGLRVMPRKERRTIPLLLRGLVGASHRVDLNDATSMDRVRHTLEKLWPACTTEVKEWKQWARAIQRDAPSLLVLLVHTDQEEGTDVQTIEIASDALGVSRLHERHVRKVNSGDGVLVLLMGCSPLLPTVRFQNVVNQFLWAGQGSAVVVSSMADMLGRHAGPTTAAMLAGLEAMVRQGEVSVGDAFVRLRRTLLSGGDPLMLGLAVYGDVDWYLDAPTSLGGNIDADTGDAASGVR
ncbi:hypothetical protein G4177_02955 [Corallococcus sp. ZKHCc1 1396]|uniref:CHAT domain-containing protein n=1 Tax=Corallococcus soli TaxID=2710757 RepID=A0ABR9PGU2_9BACT|nr:hypothetical protein [Corallococcus soli]MBE4747133.1 hypothetical protein [Corallococcus soli]